MSVNPEDWDVDFAFPDFNLALQGVPKVRSSTICLYFSTIRLNHFNKSCAFQYNSLFSYFLYHLLTRVFDLCTSAPKVRVREYTFQPHIFCIS